MICGIPKSSSVSFFDVLVHEIHELLFNPEKFAKFKFSSIMVSTLCFSKLLVFLTFVPCSKRIFTFNLSFDLLV